MRGETTPNNHENLEVRSKFLQRFIDLRENYIDDIPEEILSPDIPNFQLYKCRTNFFNDVLQGIIRMRRSDIKLSDQAAGKCVEFEEFCESISGTKRKYEKEDIDKANDVLDILITELS